MKEIDFNDLSETDLIKMLTDPDNPTAFKACEKLRIMSEQDNKCYVFFDDFAKLLDHKNSFVRNRAIGMITANVKWDTEDKINDILPALLSHIMDPKPVTSRQCIKALPLIATQKTYLISAMITALQDADTSSYTSSMRPLVENDIRTALKALTDIS